MEPNQKDDDAFAKRIGKLLGESLGGVVGNIMNPKLEVRSYHEAASAFAKRKKGTRTLIIGPNTQLVRLDYGYETANGNHSYAVHLYGHDLLRYFPDGTFSVDAGGQNTPTTIARLEDFGPRGYEFRFRDRKLQTRCVGNLNDLPSVWDFIEPQERLPVEM